MMATFVRKPGSLETRQAECRNRGRLAMAMLSYNNIGKGHGSPQNHPGRDVDEESVAGGAVGRLCVAGAGAGKNLRAETVALGAGVASPAKGAGRLGSRGGEG